MWNLLKMVLGVQFNSLPHKQLLVLGTLELELLAMSYLLGKQWAVFHFLHSLCYSLGINCASETGLGLCSRLAYESPLGCSVVD